MTETSEFPEFMGRLLERWIERVGEADTYDLAEFIAFRDLCDAGIQTAIDAGRARPIPWTWAEIGDAADMRRDNAFRKWGRRGDHNDRPTRTTADGRRRRAKAGAASA
jgi:hypothetical protein